MVNFFLVLFLMSPVIARSHVITKNFQHLIDCEPRIGANLLGSNCKTAFGGEQIELFPGDQWESDVTLSYDLSCHDVLTYQADSGFDLNGVPIRLATSGTMSTTTASPIFLSYTNLKDAFGKPIGLNDPFASYVDCDLMIEMTVTTPSQDLMQSWENLIRSHQNEIVGIEASIEGWQAAIDSIAMYDALSALADSFHKDLTNKDLLRVRQNSVALAASIGKTLAFVECGSLSDAEKISLTSTLGALFALHDPAKWTHDDGSIKKVADFYRPEDRDALIAFVSQNDPAAKETFQTRIDEARVQIGNLQKEISETEVLIHRYADEP